MKKIQILAAVLLSSFMFVAHAATDWNTQEYDLYPGDFNGDGKTDLLYVAKDVAKPSGIALSDGNGPNIPHQSWPSNYLGFPWGGNTYRAIVADFNGDGRSDVFMQRNSPGDHYVILASTDGKLVGINQTVGDFGVWSADQHPIVAGDFNGDNKADLFLQAAKPGIANLVAYANDGGVFGFSTQSWIENDYLGLKWSKQDAFVHVGDFNGDGKKDLLLQARPKFITIDYDVAFPVPTYPPNLNGVVLSQGGASPFQQAGVRAFSRNAFGADFSPLTSTVVVGDFNGDGRSDVVLQARNSGRTSFLLNGNASGAAFSNGVALANNVGLSADGYRLIVGNFDGVGGTGLYLQTTSSGGANTYANTITGGNISVSAHDPSVATGVVPVNTAGITPGSFGIGSDGAANYSIPIVVPPGVAGLEPRLALNYSSSRGNGWVGMGWDLSGLSQITRCRKTFAQDGVAEPVTLSMNDRFCLDGTRLRRTSGTYGAAGSTYQLEIETFSRITAYGTAGNGPAYFKVEMKNGLTFEYGGTPDSRIESLSASANSTPRTWALNRVSDRVGNTMSVSYAEDSMNGSFHPTEMLYTSNAGASVSAAYKVVFAWEARPTVDSLTGYFAGGLVKETVRLKRIETQFNDPQAGGFRPVRRYQLSYVLNSRTGRSGLSAVQECDGSGNCLSPTNISWQQGQSGLEPSALLLPVQVQLEDISGDGFDDLVYYDPTDTATVKRVFYRLGNPSASGGYGPEQDSGFRSISVGAPMDYDGDGRMDVLCCSGTRETTFLSYRGSGFTLLRTGVENLGKSVGDADGDGWQDFFYATGGNPIQVQFNGPSGIGPRTTVFTPNQLFTAGSGIFGSGDFNADGRTDLLIQSGNSGGARLLLSQGRSYSDTGLVLPDASLPATGDFNGDGIDDLTYNCGSNRCFRFGGAGSPTVGLGAEKNSGQIGGTLGAFVLDWDGDGKADILQRASSGTVSWMRSNGETLSAPLDTGIVINGQFYAAYGQDINGDGLTDFLFTITNFINSGGATESATYLSRHRPGVGDLVSSIVDGFGNTTNVTYAPLTDAEVYTRGNGATFPQVDVQQPMQVVKRYTQTDGTGGTYTVSAKYSGARIDKTGRGFLGFASRRIQDSRDGTYVYDYYRQDFPFIGAVSQRDELQGDNATLVARVTNSYTSTTLDATAGNQRYLVTPTQTVTKRYEVGGAKNGVQITEQAMNVVYDGFANPTDVTVNTVDKDSASPFFNQVWQTRAVSTYTTDMGSAWCSLPNQSTVTNALPDGTTQSRRVDYAIDLARCRPTQQVIEPLSTTLKVTSNFGYDSCGNLKSIGVIGKKPDGSDMATRTSSVNFGSRCVFPETATNALGQATSASHRYDIGELSSVTDSNGLTTSATYDNFGRVLRQTRPDGTATDLYYSRCTNTNGYCGVPDLRFQVQSVERDTANGTINTSVSFFDSLGRARISQIQRATGAVSYVSSTYDSLGRLVTRSRPYSSGSKGFSRSTYDLLNRVTKVELVRPDSSIDRMSTITYAGGTVTSTDPKLRTRQQTFDPAGLLRKVTDASGTTQYTYDPFRNLKALVDPLGNTTTTAFDIRGFRTSISDPDRGTSSFTFNSLGELLSQTDAKNQTVTLTYDNLSRVRTRTEPEGTTTFTFDTAAHGIGELASVVSPGGYAEAYQYDSLSRPQQVTYSYTGDAAYQVNYDYNNQGLLDAVTYPTSTSNYRLKLKYAYAYGSLVQVKDFNAPAMLFWSLNATDDSDNPIDETLGRDEASGASAMRQTSNYNPLTDELISRQSGSGSSTTNLQNLAYQWDTTGNLKQRQDALQNNRTEVFSYDSLDRLTGSTLDGVSNLSVAFDALGNITSKSDVGAYNYTAAQTGCSYYTHTQPHAVRKAGNNVYCYDQNGNMTKRAGSTVAYTSYDLPSQINQGSDSSQFSYGASRERWKQVATYGGTTETTIYVAGLLDKVTRGGVTEYRHYIATGSDASAIYTRRSNGTTETYYVTGDHLGSTSVIADRTGALKLRESFTAFGARRGSNWSGTPSASDLSQLASVTRDGFTGQEHLDNVGLIHMNGRVYDPTLGRFLSADPFVQDPENSQSLNRYSYVFNSPLSYTDPTGFLTVGNPDGPSPNPSPDLAPGITSPGLDFGNFTPFLYQQLAAATLFGYYNPYYFGPKNLNSSGPKNDAAFTNGGMQNGNAGFFGITVGDVADVTPLVGTIKGIYEAYQDPSFVNIIGAVVSVAPGGGAAAGKILKVVTKVVSARKAAKATSTVSRKADDVGKAVSKETCCFVAGTLVSTEEGLRAIEEIEVGDRVLSRDEVTGETGYKEVTELIRRHNRDIWEVIFEISDDASELSRAVFETTDDHPWRLDAGVWARTDELQSGMRVLRAQGFSARVVSVRKTDRFAPTFNLEVADFHTYFVGEAGVWVHNECGKFGNKVSFPKAAIDKITQESRVIGKGGISVGQRALQKKVGRPGNKFDLPEGIPTQAQVEAEIGSILTSKNVAIKEVGPTSALPNGGFKVRADGVGSRGLLLDKEQRFVDFAN